MEVHLHPHWQCDDFAALVREPLSTGSGRGTVNLVHHPRGLLVERIYRHGGARRKVLPRTFRKSDRAAHEYAVHRRVFEAGVATVEPVGWAEAPAGLPGCRRYYFYSRYLPEARPIPQVGELSTAQLKQMARTLKALHGLGVFHTDLNLNNWLAAGDRALLIDFDRAKCGDFEPEAYLVNCLSRMLRSAKKLGLLNRSFILKRFLLVSADEFGLNARRVLDFLPTKHFSERIWDKCRWVISGGHQG